MPVIARAVPGKAERGFTLVEMIVVVFLLAIAMLGLLAVFDASARINKSEQDVADAQGNVRFGIYQMTRAIRMAGAGPLYITQAIRNTPDPGLLGITVASGTGYDNVTGARVTDLSGTQIPVRDGTDMIEVRGVINSPLLTLKMFTNCPCVGTENVTVATVVNAMPSGEFPVNAHVNNDPARPQFAAVDAYTAGVTPANPMLVILTGNGDLHGQCATVNPLANPPVAPHYPQPPYDVGLLTAPTTLVASQTMGNVNFGSAVATQFNGEFGTAPPGPLDLREVGVLDDLVFFIDNTDPVHPGLAQGTRRGTQFDVVRLADDVEDMQIAYGVDTDGNGGINRLTAVTATDTDQNVSTQVGGDEWRPNVTAEAPYLATDFVTVAAPCHAPALHGVMISLVAKSKDPDPTYRSPNARGIVVMNTPVTILPPYPDTAQYPTLSTVPQFRRRIQTLKINLRNYAFE
jgi:prepilin-type N-terminal cleavage/methylation domain-containing protein